MNEHLQEFFFGISKAIKSNTIDIIILTLIVTLAIILLVYIYYIYPKYTAYIANQKILKYIKKRYLLYDYEIKAFNFIINNYSISPEHLIFIDKPTFEKYEKELAKSLKYYSNNSLEADIAIKLLRKKLFDEID